MKETKISIFKDLYKSTDVPYIVTLEKSLDRIKTGASKETVELIRNGKKDLKTKLPSIVFSGEFAERKKDGLIKHSGLMVLDFDKVDNIVELKEELKKNNHFVAIFTSPSGKGVKGVIKIPICNAKEHESYFKEFQKKFDYSYLDKSGSNVDRVCFESYDEDIYVNYKAEVFKPTLIDEGFTISERVPMIPITNEERIIEMIMKFNWSKDYVEGQKNNYIFDLAGAFCEYGISQTTAESFLYNHVVAGNAKDEQGKMNTIKSAYRSRQFGSKYFEDFKKIDTIKVNLKNGKEEVCKKYDIAEDVFDEINNEFETDDFWSIEKDKKVKIVPIKYKFFLERNGFKKYFPCEANKPNLVKIQSNKVTDTSIEKIKDFVLNYLLERSEIDVWSYCANYQTLFSEQFLLMLETIDLMMLKDSADTSYLAFKNGILKVTKNEATMIDFIDVDGYIWESQIINRNFVISKNDNEYKTFIKNISNGEPLPIECVIGYLLSSYKNKMNNKAIILNDEVISDNPEGGTGKGLFIQGIKQLKKTSILDGKAFDDKKSFPYQTVSQDCTVLVFDDVKQNFNFESKFSLVTEGLTLERKNKDAIKLSVEESPKIVISTNYAIKGAGNSHDRRRHELEFAQYYNGSLTPYDEFKRQLFDDWTEKEFTAFDNYMVNCLQVYLKNGLISQNAKNLKMRKLIAETAMEFFEWAEDVHNLPRNIQNDKQKFFDDFTNEYQDFKRWLQRKKFNVFIKKYCEFKKFTFEEGITLGNRWFKINDDSEETSDLPF